MFGLGAPQGVKPATGIEISERFGQVYNLETGRRTFSKLYLDSLIGYLAKGTDSRTSGYATHYIGISISDNEEDSENVKKLKEKLRNRILEEMQYKKKGTKDIKDMLFELSEKDDVIKNKYKNGYAQYSKIILVMLAKKSAMINMLKIK